MIRVLALVASALAITSTWSEPRVLSDTPRAIGPDLAMNATGGALVVWDSETGPDCPQSPGSLTCIHTVKAAARASTASAWASAGSLAQPGVGAAPRAAVNDAGQAIVIWVHDIGRDRVVQATYRAGPAQAFPEPTDLSGDVLEAHSHRAALDAAGNAVVAWEQRRELTFDVAVATRSATSGTWGAPTVLSSGPVASGPSLAVTPAGDAYVAWIEAADVKVAHGDVGRSFWDAPTTLSRAGGHLAGDVLVAVNAAGDAIASWSWLAGPRGETIAQAAVKPVGGTWSDAADLGTGVRAHVALARDGAAVAVWIADGAPRSARRPVGGPWSPPERIGAAATEVRVAVDARGDTVALWRDSTSLMSARRAAGGAWQPAERLSAGDATGLGVALDAAGNAVATWNVHSGDGIRVLTSDLPAAWTPTLVNTRRPSVRGRARVGRTVTCERGAWDGSFPIRFTYRWLLDGRSTAEGRDYRVKRTDVGRRLSCRVGATNAAGTRTATSAVVRVRR